MGGDLHSTRNSRLTHDRTPNSAPPPAPHTAPDWKVGDRVLARYRTMNRGWYEAVIVAVNDGGTCYLRYDDGDSDEDVPSDKMKWPAPTVSAQHPESSRRQEGEAQELTLRVGGGRQEHFLRMPFLEALVVRLESHGLLLLVFVLVDVRFLLEVLEVLQPLEAGAERIRQEFRG
jgi:hypothetical protein